MVNRSAKAPRKLDPSRRNRPELHWVQAKGKQNNGHLAVFPCINVGDGVEKTRLNDLVALAQLDRAVDS